MAILGLLNAYGSTVGDNLEHHLAARELKARGHQVLHLWNFNRQKPSDVKKCGGLVAGCGGILWKGSPVRDFFFVSVIRLAKRALGLSIGYNQGEPLSERWIHAVNHMDHVAARDPHTLNWVRAHCRAPVSLHASLAWSYEPGCHADKPRYDLGLILNRRAFEINVGTGNPWTLYPGLKGLSCLEIPFAQPVEQPYTKAVPNNHKLAGVASAEIRKCKAVYTQRLHGFILALLNGVPAICHGGGFKVQGQAEMGGYPLLRTFKDLQALDQKGWRALIQESSALETSKYVIEMRKSAQGHVKELEKWLQTL